MLLRLFTSTPSARCKVHREHATGVVLHLPARLRFGESQGGWQEALEEQLLLCNQQATHQGWSPSRPPEPEVNHLPTPPQPATNIKHTEIHPILH